MVLTVLPKTHKAPDSYINVTVDFGTDLGMIPLNSIVEKAQAYRPKQSIFDSINLNRSWVFPLVF